jgi:hypothetical protein
MKPMKRALRCLTAVALISLVAAITASAAAPPLSGHIVPRPLTPQELKTYSLTGVQTASGLATVAINQSVYLDALINAAVPPADIVSVNWLLSDKPPASTATLTNSPLGSGVPPYSMVDRLDYQVAGRTMLRPDVVGQYTVTATITTGSSGTTTVTQTVTAATYLGLNTCALCHSGGLIASNMVTPWSKTHHATAFSMAIDGKSTDHFTKNCIGCHVVGFDSNTNSANGGFDDVAAQVGWVPPTVLTNGNWAAMPASLKNVANIQCENCHGPGSQHAYSLGATNLISKTLGAGSCAQCHDSLTHHFKTAEWNNSRHAVAVEETEADCARCHAAQGYVNFASGTPAKAVPYEVITCGACHDPHDAANPHQIRTPASVTLMDKKTTITTNTAGTGLVCMNCHMGRRDATNYVEITAGSNRYGPHHGPQTDMLMGANAMNYGKVIPSSAHREVVEDSCVTCHMQDAETSPAFTHAGGHTFSLKWDSGTNVVELTEACVKCHGEIEDFNFKRQDYDGNGVVEGVQTEVRGLLSRLALLLPPVGVAKTNHSPSNIAITSSWTRPQLRAAFNYLFVVEDGSYGIHNLSYAVGLLKTSIADLTGDSNNDTLPDSWQVQYFGSANSPNAAPKAMPAGDGVPNWMKYILGLNPLLPGISVTNGLSVGVVWADGNSLANPYGTTNTIQIYTAAEVAFNTESNKTYQIQAASSVSSGWQNIGYPISGTGKAISYVTPTRQNVQQFYRVYSY